MTIARLARDRLTGVIMIVVGLVLQIPSFFSHVSTARSEANIGSFSGAQSLNNIGYCSPRLLDELSRFPKWGKDAVVLVDEISAYAASEPAPVGWSNNTKNPLRSSTMSDPDGAILTIIPCPHPLTMVELLRDGPLHEKPIAHYHPIVAIMYRYPFREKMKHSDGSAWWLPPSVEYSTDHEQFHSHPGTHQTTEDGGCECTGRRLRRGCRLFGMFARTPEELKADPQLTDDINRRIAYVNEVAIRLEEKQKIQKERGRIYAQRAKEKKLAKQAATAANVIS